MKNEYMSYQAMLTQVNTSTVTLRKVCDRLELKEHGQALNDMQKKLQNHTFRVGIMGEFKRGKSTVINALLGQEIVPADILPCSATLNRIVWDTQPHAQINFKKDENGLRQPSKQVSVEELSEYVTKLTEESEKQSSKVEDAVVYYPCEFCKNGVEIVDTPGLNDDERMNYVSESVIPTLDAIIMVLVPGAPFSMSEAAFVRNKIMTSDLSRLVFVVNKIDTVRARDRQRVVEGIRSKIYETILDKTASIYGEDSEEYKDTKSKLGGIRIYPISAADALDGKLENDNELYQNSGMPEFENALAKLLTEERGMLELVGPVSMILSKVKEADGAIQMRRNAMGLEKEKFEKIQAEAMERINASREEKMKKVKEIKGVAASTYQELLPMVAESYDELERTVTNYVDQYAISAQVFESEASRKGFQETLSTKINEQFQASLQESTEKIQVEITKRLNNEIEDLEVYSGTLSAELEQIRCMIPNTNPGSGKNISGTDFVAIAAETATNFAGIAGVGSAITGFKEHGVLGGIVGFGSGFVATHLAATATAVVLGGVTAATAVPILVIAGIVGTVGGKGITNTVFKLFGKDKKSSASSRESDIVKVRNQLKSAVHKNVDQLRAEHKLEYWLKETTDMTFNGLSEKLDQEAEQALQGMQDTLTGIQVDLANDKAHREVALEKLKSAEEDLSAVLLAMKPIKDKLDNSLCEAAI